MSDVLRVGLVGFGTVGAGLARCLLNNQDLIDARAGRPVRLAKVADLDITTDRGVPTDSFQLLTDAFNLVNDPEIDVIVELVGGRTFAFDLQSAALRAGKDVVTANKALLAYLGRELFELAEQADRFLFFEGAVGGGIPIIQGIRTGLAASRIDAIYGILNGTANYLLTRMAQDGQAYASALREAQQKGYAEADPTFDVEGHDTAHKLTILATLCFGGQLAFEDVVFEGITGIEPLDLEMVNQLGYTIKLLAIARRVDQAFSVRVHPALISKKLLLAAVNGVNNAVLLVGNPVGPVLFYGRGAGGDATGAAVAGDLVEIARRRANGHGPGSSPFVGPKLQVQSKDQLCIEYYLRLTLRDRPGVLAQVAGILGRHGISIATVVQQAQQADQPVPVFITTHQANEGNMRKALAEIETLECSSRAPFVLRIEPLNLW